MLRTGLAVLFVALAAPPGAPPPLPLPLPPSPSPSPSRPLPHPASVLVVGNSLSYTNSMPAMLEALAASSPAKVRLVIRTVMAGGARLEDHWRSGEAVRVIREVRPDVVILQAQGHEALSEPEGFARHARLFAEAAARVGARTVILGTWARAAGDPYYRYEQSGGTREEMQRRLGLAYTAVATELHAELSPAGDAFERATRDLARLPMLDASGIHPTVAGSYLAACVLHDTLLGTAALGASYRAGLSEEDALVLQRLAARVVRGR